MSYKRILRRLIVNSITNNKLLGCLIQMQSRELSLTTTAGFGRGGVMRTKASFQRNGRVVASPVPRNLLFTPFLLLFLIGALLANRSALAGSTVGSFEIDGNLIVDHSVPTTEPLDWDCSPFPAALTTFTDGTGPTDDIFGQGSKENDQSTWVCTAGSAPPKDNLVNEISINGAPPIT